MAITSMDAILRQAAPEEVTLSGWAADEVTFLLRRPSLVAMASGGHVPNPLIPVVEKLLMGQPDAQADSGDSARALLAVARAAMVQPTLMELEEAGVALTDAQVMEIYAYALGGPLAVATFRGSVRGGNGEPDAVVPHTGKRADGHRRPVDSLVRGRGNPVAGAEAAQQGEAASAPDEG